MKELIAFLAGSLAGAVGYHYLLNPIVKQYNALHLKIDGIIAALKK